MALPINLGPGKLSTNTAAAPSIDNSAVSTIANKVVTAVTGNEAQSKAASSIPKTSVPPASQEHVGPSVNIQSLTKDHELLAKIFERNPTWEKAISSWSNVSLKDKVWLLQLYELRNLCIPLWQIDKLHSIPCKTMNTFIPAEFTPSLLHSIHEIEKALADITEANFVGKNLQTCTEAIALLVNLKSLNLTHNKLITPPDISHNPKLEWLWLGYNQLTTLPDVSHNPELRTLFLVGNPLSAEKQKLEELRKIKTRCNVVFG